MRITFYALLFLLCACQNSEPVTEATSETAPALPEENLLLPEDPTGIPLLPVSFTDSALLVANWAMSPKATFRINTFAARSANETLNTLINTTLANVVADEEAPMQTTDLRKVVITSVKNRLLDYKKHSVDTAEVAEFPNSWALDIDYTTDVLHNADSVLTLATTYYAYTGGAHGNYGTGLDIFDLVTGKLLTDQDILLPEAKDALEPMLLALVDKDMLFDGDVLPPTSNIGLIKAGVLFSYPPYEVGPYAAGEIKIILPYADVAALLTPSGKVIAKRIGGL